MTVALADYLVVEPIIGKFNQCSDKQQLITYGRSYRKKTFHIVVADCLHKDEIEMIKLFNYEENLAYNLNEAIAHRSMILDQVEQIQ